MTSVYISPRFGFCFLIVLEEEIIYNFSLSYFPWAKQLNCIWIRGTAILYLSGLLLLPCAWDESLMQLPRSFLLLLQQWRKHYPHHTQHALSLGTALVRSFQAQPLRSLTNEKAPQECNTRHFPSHNIHFCFPANPGKDSLSGKASLSITLLLLSLSTPTPLEEQFVSQLQNTAQETKA